MPCFLGEERLATTLNKSIPKAIRILEIVCSVPHHLSIRDIAQRANYSISTTHRILVTLCKVGAIEPVAGQCFALGPKLVALHGRIAADMSHTRAKIEQELKQLLHEPGVSARLSVLIDDALVIVAGCDNGVNNRFRSRIGGVYQAYCTAPGKTLLAALPPDVFNQYLISVPLHAMTRNTIIEQNRLRREISHVRSVGYAFDDEEYLDGVRCVSVALPALEQGEIAALSLATEALPPRQLIESVLPRLAVHASTLARELRRLPRGLSALIGAQGLRELSAP